MYKKYLSLIFILISTFTAAQTDIAILKGKITDEKGEPLSYASVVLKEINNGTLTDNAGNYKIPARSGSYTLEITYIGYEKFSEKITLQGGKTVSKDFKLKSTSFVIGGIEVTAHNDFIPVTPETKSVVSSGEIEHIQASSLSDVLKVTPGVETTSNATLANAEKASIRKGDALGTQIVLDGVPVSNTANMQTGIGYSTSNSGIDLRAIPAENIREVEIVRGIPSARYGDLADGLLIVKTKSSAEPFRAKYKYNPQLNEFNFSGGTSAFGWIFNSNLNVAVSERDVRVEGDGYTRIAGQISAEKENEDFSLKNIIYVTRAMDESKEKPGYALRDAWYNRDLNIKYTGSYTHRFSSFSSFNMNISGGWTKQDSYSQSLISRDNIVITDNLNEGAVQGKIVFGSYLGKKWIKGDVWNLYADANYNFRFFTDDLLHTITGGTTWRNDFNKGEGIVFDPLYPPSLSTSAQRLRSYENLPHYNNLSLYAEDRITGRLFRPFTLQVGVRYEVYRPNGFDLKGLWGQGDLIKSYNGSFLNPRINFSYNLAEDTQLRMSYGVTSKAPPLGMIAAQKKYVDIVDTVAVKNPSVPESNFSIISTNIRNIANEYIKGYKQNKYEISLDQQIGSVGFTATGYYNNSDNMFDAVSTPTVFYKYSYPSWPDVSSMFVKDSLLDSYAMYSNSRWQKVSGIEVTFRTRKIPVINTIFTFDAAYTHQESGRKNNIEYGGQRFSSLLGIKVIPAYNYYVDMSKDLLLNYRFEIQSKSLGMWITLHIQQKLIEFEKSVGYGDTLAVGYFTQKGQFIIIPESERASEKYTQLRKNIEYYELLDEDLPNKFLFNVKVSKSLWSGASVSFYVNNFLNSRPVYKTRRSNPLNPMYEIRNPNIFYGIELSAALGGLAE